MGVLEKQRDFIFWEFPVFFMGHSQESKQGRIRKSFLASTRGLSSERKEQERRKQEREGRRRKRKRKELRKRKTAERLVRQKGECCKEKKKAIEQG